MRQKAIRIIGLVLAVLMVLTAVAGPLLSLLYRRLGRQTENTGRRWLQ